MKDLLTLDEVAQIANVSKPTIYRRVKHNGFPKPIKVPRAGDRGPKTVNRWERGQVMGWLMKGNDPATDSSFNVFGLVNMTLLLLTFKALCSTLSSTTTASSVCLRQSCDE